MSLTQPLAYEIQSFRKITGLSQAGLAKALGASLRAVEEWEAGRRNAPPMIRLAMAAVNAQLEPFYAPPPEWIDVQLNKALKDGD